MMDADELRPRSRSAERQPDSVHQRPRAVVGTQLPDHDPAKSVRHGVVHLRSQRLQILIADHDPGVRIMEPGNLRLLVPTARISREVVVLDVLITETSAWRRPCRIPRSGRRASVGLVEPVIRRPNSLPARAYK